MLAGCGSADPRVSQIQSELQATGKTPSDETIKQIISETEAKYGDVTVDEYGYPIYGRRPFELPEQEWSWFEKGPYDVRPEGSKSAPLVEHRYVQLHYPGETAIAHDFSDSGGRLTYAARTGAYSASN
jgi:hypothetical protein